ncbi:MAG: putative zinc metalloprotease [Parcubacteria group bacterium]|nr:putative zinc metalloprotease [Parcubacteria group bacterium]
MQVRSLGFVVALLALPLFLFGPFTAVHVSAQTAEQIQQQIADHNKKIADLDAEIATYQKQLNTLGGQHQTLATSIQSLDTTRKQLTAKIKSLQQQIGALALELRQLSAQIADKQTSIDLNKRAVAQSLRDIATADNSTVVEQVFSSANLTDAWAAVDANMALNQALQSNTQQLAQVKQQLSAQELAVNQTQDKLVGVTTDLGTQKKAVDATVSQKNQLLTQTKNQESTYQSLIATKKAQQKAFESELNSLEASLKSVGTASIPKTGQGILAWPFSASVMANCATKKSALGNIYCVTQYFGNTAFAASGAYNGSGHNGIDIGIPTGTPVQSSLGGVVLATGNTDAIPGCYSFGKWVMVQHANGLSTMYAHLSSIGVAKGQSVSTGSVLGYSGMTGYATGPHLHYGVYASAGVQIMTLASFRGATSPCANATMPVAPLNAYLNPISYL